jgi:hypothetical protein
MITGNQVTAGTAASTLMVCPPGPAMVVVSNPSSVTVYFGSGTGVTTGNGLPVPAGQTVAFACYQGDKGGTLSVIAASGTANSVGWMVSSATGQTGP